MTQFCTLLSTAYCYGNRKVSLGDNYWNKSIIFGLFFFWSCIPCGALIEHFHDDLDLGLSAYGMQFGFLHFECVTSYVYSSVFVGGTGSVFFKLLWGIWLVS